MQIIRTIVMVLLLLALAVFSFANWEPIITVRIWHGLLLDTKLPVIVVFSFLFGFLPMWAYHALSRWQMQRRLLSLQSAALATGVIGGAGSGAQAARDAFAPIGSAKALERVPAQPEDPGARPQEPEGDEREGRIEHGQGGSGAGAPEADARPGGASGPHAGQSSPASQPDLP